MRLTFDVRYISALWKTRGVRAKASECSRRYLVSAGSTPIDINDLMCVMLDSVERLAPQPSTSSSGLSMELAVSPSCVPEVRLTADYWCRIIKSRGNVPIGLRHACMSQPTTKCCACIDH